MSALLLDIGDEAQGVVIDANLWERESRVRRLRPEQLAAGSVRALWPHAPHIAGILTDSGDRLTIRVLR